ncbi:MAG: hypothetical protein C5B50_29735 [Verrucomicrobia bacterium]|nr:MAG: hypothetical protein C5B50_29735 [Verrucomicrobiota bacterium]
MIPSALSCSQCKTPFPEELFGQAEPTPCPTCGTYWQIEVFPAFFRRITPGKDGELLLTDGEASCFYHPNKKAAIPCQNCGRFLCALCDCDLHGKHICPACLEAGKTKGKIQNLENRRTLYDSIALSLAVLPLLIFYFTAITAPIALYVAIRYWNRPLSLIRRTKWRYVLAIVIAGLQIIGWGVGIYFLAKNWDSNG